MPRKANAASEPKAQERFTTTKIRPEILRKANMVAMSRGTSARVVTLFEYLHSILEPAIERDYQAMIDEEHRKGTRKHS
jgi:hypothetical protein